MLAAHACPDAPTLPPPMRSWWWRRTPTTKRSAAAASCTWRCAPARPCTSPGSRTATVSPGMRASSGARSFPVPMCTGRSVAAAARKHVPPPQSSACSLPCQHFLGYPDGGLTTLAADAAHYDRPWRSLRTGAEAVAGLDSISPGAPYSGRALESDLNSLLTHIRPTLVIGPSAADRHADHQAVAALLRRLLAARGQSGRLRGWIVHGGDKWPTPKGAHPGAAMDGGAARRGPAVGVAGAGCRSPRREARCHRGARNAGADHPALHAQLPAGERAVVT